MIIYKKLGGFDQVRFTEASNGSYHTSSFAQTAVAPNTECDYVILPTSNDVLNGRGKSIHAWHGNVLYRNLIQYYKLEYIVASPEEQKNIANRIIGTIRGLTPVGRFLDMDKNTGTWCDIGNDKALFKVRQALREGAPELRQQLTPNDIGRPLNDTMSDDEYAEFVGIIFEDSGMDCSCKQAEIYAFG